jgi:spore coat polysaccharide biosynthesis protein SpsF (cytidylyltransferase family)
LSTGILIIARLGSTRLPEKHLIDVGGRSFIDWLAHRYLYGFQSLIDTGKVRIVIATSTEGENEKFEKIFKDSVIDVFYGSDENIPFRQLQCALKYGFKNIISVDGDDILCSVTGAIKILEQLNNGEQAVKTTGLPLGMNLMGYTCDYLHKALDKYDIKQKIETGWGRVFESNIKNLELSKLRPNQRLRFTLDYEQDELFFKKIITHFGDNILSATDEEVIDFVIENKVYKMNDSLNKIYWNNFINLKQSEL